MGGRWLVLTHDNPGADALALRPSPGRHLIHKGLALTISIDVKSFPRHAEVLEKTRSAVRALVGESLEPEVRLSEIVGGRAVPPGLETMAAGAVYAFGLEVEGISAEVSVSLPEREAVAGFVSDDEAGLVVHVNIPSVRTPTDLVLGAALAVAGARTCGGVIHELIQQVAAQMGNDFEPLPFEPREELPPTFLNRTIGIPFNLVIGGAFRMGLSKEEEQRARQLCDPIPATLAEMRPVHERHVQTALVSVIPVLWRHFGESLRNPAEAIDGPCFVTKPGAVGFAETLGCRLPSETEWEYACRAGSQSLFTWGDDLASDEELEGWLS